MKVLDVIPTEQERSEWARMADSCEKAGKNCCYLYRAASKLNGPMKPWTYDALQKTWRRWLVFGVHELPDDGLAE